ncbi:hypothetical protein MSAN_01155400 [Mycena sanguinolenta]|uniref:Uncharacterized protein n=1 Tax=Mycena sanguinolenta TaxID=230812 RepID=A0A8H6YHB2_9AGAR|nr:hypothetical protein MSAN_01155400 [Mycena sanguinolenta]
MDFSNEIIADSIHLTLIALSRGLVIDRSQIHLFNLPKIQPGHVHIFEGRARDQKPRGRIQWFKPFFSKTQRKWNGFEIVTTTISQQNSAHYNDAIKYGYMAPTPGSTLLSKTSVYIKINERKFWINRYTIGAYERNWTIVHQWTSLTIEGTPHKQEDPEIQGQSTFPAAQEECVGRQSGNVFWDDNDWLNTETWANENDNSTYPNGGPSATETSGEILVSGALSAYGQLDSRVQVPRIRGHDVWLGLGEYGSSQNNNTLDDLKKAHSLTEAPTLPEYPIWGDAAMWGIDTQEPSWSLSSWTEFDAGKISRTSSPKHDAGSRDDPY